VNTLNFVRSVRHSALVLAATLIAATASAQTSTWKIDPAHSRIEFKVRHLGVSNVRGILSIPKATPYLIHLDDKDITKSSVEVTIDAASVNTNEPARDNHLKSDAFFNVAVYPTLTFKSTRVYKDGGKLMMTGDLTLNSITKPVTLLLDGPAPPQTDAKGTTRSGFSATGTLHRKDFNFGSGFASTVISDDVDFTIDVEMDKQP
jgi:polyisoprenoid-binding protein YceI